MMDAGRFIETLVNAGTYLSDEKASYSKKTVIFSYNDTGTFITHR